jgi:hypothetical protein
MSLILACRAGVYIGLYFNVLALFPFTILGAGAFIMSAWASGQKPARQRHNLGAPLISCQAGYMLGLTARGVYGQVLSRLNFGQSKQV